MAADLRGRRALVTGAGIRVGRVLALACADLGIDVVVHYRSSDAPAERTAADCRAKGVRAVAIAGDLATAAGCRRVAAAAELAMEGIDVLVCSASSFVAGDFAEMTEEQVDRALAVNLKAPFFLAQALAPAMRGRGFGRIVNMADVAGLEPWPRFIPHSMAKAGLVMLTKSLAQELAPEITVNAIAPGAILMPDDAPPGAEGRSAEKAVLKRVGSPDDAAAALRYLLEADFVTGHVLVVDGGRLVRP